ncbi:hypothetical protein LEP1GSC178_2041 [Leptospira licerasiae str. MMD4847]|uniref:Uncharacterized protein n=1 Tax=Leptospira licerasiae str. MMD4847 TaxID=1049971 RepID=A0ABN0HD37_9LEPT|nr:hypothetical protein LEP1GSC178_2041 [Leptospira licerasiae str. MMD4847]
MPFLLAFRLITSKFRNSRNVTLKLSVMRLFRPNLLIKGGKYFAGGPTLRRKSLISLLGDFL